MLALARFRRVVIPVSMAMALLLGGGCAPAEEGSAAPLPSATAESSGTVLRLRFVGEEGNPVSPATAEILCVAWGDTERLALRPDADRLAVPLDKAWLRERWPASDARAHHGFLYFTAPGYGAIRSAPFIWVGGKDREGARVASAAVSFPGGPEVTVPEGEERSLAVVFTRPRPRRLRFVDAEGNAVPGVRVTSFMFWSRYNHCAVLNGADPLGEGTSDAGGRIDVPYGDFEYAFELEDSPWVLAGSAGGDPHVLVTELSREETAVQLRERRIRPLDLRVTANGAAASGALLYGRAADAPCGANSGPLARADAQGRIALPDFRPEQYEEIYFPGGEGARPIWSADPRSPRFGDVVAIDLAVRP